jgi:hypothetical protein
MQTILRVKYDRIATATSSAAENTEATKHRRVSNRTATERLEYTKMLQKNQHRTASHKIITEKERT